MEEKKNLGEKLGTFFAGKGYYIVLLLSAAVIATSIWLMAAGSRANVRRRDRHGPGNHHQRLGGRGEPAGH